MASHVDVLGCKPSQLYPSLHVFFDRQRYMFNCGEGAQRFCVESKVRLSKTKCIFFTRLSWPALGGLPGMILTLSDIAIDTLSFVGPPGFANFLYATRHFLHREGLTLTVTEVGDASKSAAPADIPPSFSDEYLQVWPILLSPSSAVAATAKTVVLRGVGNDHQLLPTDGPGFRFVQSFGGSSGSSGSTSASPTHTHKKARVDSPEPEAPATDTREADNTFVPLPYSLQTQPPTPPHPDEPFSDQSLCYIFQTASIPGKFIKEKALALGIPPGPSFARLVKGESVTLASGVVVHPSQCVEPPSIGRVCIVLDCPTLGHVAALDSLKSYILQITASSHRLAHVDEIFHMSPLGVCESLEYSSFLAWLEAEMLRQRDAFFRIHPHYDASVFSPHHVFVNEAAGNHFIFRNALQLQQRLNFVDPHVFPPLQPTHPQQPIYGQLLPLTTTATTLQAPGETQPALSHALLVRSSNLQFPMLAAQPLLRFALMPHRTKGVQPQFVIPAESFAANSAVSDLALEGPAPHSRITLLDVQRQLASIDSGNPPHRGVLREPLTVATLGTGAAIPTKLRNVSCNLLFIGTEPPERGSSMSLALPTGGMLLDCGEGTLGQIRHMYGEDSDGVLALIKCIAISHMHADHHLGLIGVLKARENAIHSLGLHPAPPLVVIGPTYLNRWLADYSRWVEPLSYKFCANRRLGGGRSFGTTGLTSSAEHMEDELEEATMPFVMPAALRSPCHPWDPSSGPMPPACSVLEELLGITSIVNVPVLHCYDAHGFVVSHRSGWKIVYSGDTRPCSGLAEAGRGATMCIHEATFDVEHSKEALEKAHSTTAEALHVCEQMEARYALLTHFSQRYHSVLAHDSAGSSNSSGSGAQGMTSGTAVDLMSLRRADFDKLPVLAGAIELALAEVMKRSDADEVGEAS